MKKKFTPHFLIIATLVLLLTTPIIHAQAAPTLEIVNLSGASYLFTYAQLAAMPKTVVRADLYCDGALATYGAWGGVQLSYLLTQAQAAPEVASVQFAASDGYRVAIPIALAMQPQIIIAYEKDNQSLAEGLRLIIPDANGASWIALIVSMTMSSGGAEYPQSVSVGGGGLSAVIETQNSAGQTSSPQQTATPKPTQPQDSANDQSANPANITHEYQPVVTPQSSSETSSLQALIIPATAFAIATALTATTYLVYKQKKKPVDN